MHNPFRVRPDLATRAKLGELVRLIETTLVNIDPDDTPWQVRTVDNYRVDHDITWTYVTTVTYEEVDRFSTSTPKATITKTEEHPTFAVHMKHDDWMKTKIELFSGPQYPLSNHMKKRLWNLFTRGAIRMTDTKIHDQMAPAAAVSELEGWLAEAN